MSTNKPHNQDFLSGYIHNSKSLGAARCLWVQNGHMARICWQGLYRDVGRSERSALCYSDSRPDPTVHPHGCVQSTSKTTKTKEFCGQKNKGWGDAPPVKRLLCRRDDSWLIPGTHVKDTECVCNLNAGKVGTRGSL